MQNADCKMQKGRVPGLTRAVVVACLVSVPTLAWGLGPCVGQTSRSGPVLAQTSRSGAQVTPRGDLIDRALAVVGGVVITLSDVHAARDFGLLTAEGPSDPIRLILTRLIERSLILAEVDRYAPPDPDESAIAGRLRAIRGTFPTTAAFDLALARVGLEERHLRELIRQDLRIRSYLDERFTLVPVNDEQAMIYYRDHPDRFTRNGSVRQFDEVRLDAQREAAAARRQATIDQWVAGLRPRAEVVDLYTTDR